MFKKVVFVVAALVGLVLLLAAYRHVALVSPLRAQVLQQLKDPDSAQFRGERYVGSPFPGEGVLCGEVNSRTPAGGYAGFTWFMADRKRADIEPQEIRSVLDLGKVDRCAVSTTGPGWKWWWIDW